MLFDIGQNCNAIYIILSGIVDIVIYSDELGLKKRVLDSLGKGSVIGTNFILTREQWSYRAVNQSTMAARVLKIDAGLLRSLRKKHVGVNLAISIQEEFLKAQGLGQIDYVIESFRMF